MTFFRGYEKAWLALLGGGAVTAATTLALWMMSITGAVTPPDETTIVAAVTGLIGALAAAAGAFLGTNSAPTEAEPNRNQVGVPMPTAEETAGLMAESKGMPPKADSDVKRN